MVTVIRKPPDFGGISIGGQLGAGIGKGFSGELSRRRKADRTRKVQEGLSKYTNDISSMTFEEAQGTPLSKYFPPGSVEDVDDILTMEKLRIKILAQLFPDKAAAVRPQTGAVIPGQTITAQTRPEGAVTPREFANIQRGMASRADRRSKFTLTDRKNEVLGRIIANERAGRRGAAPPHQIEKTERDLVASELADPNWNAAVRISLESREFFLIRDPQKQLEFVGRVHRWLRSGAKREPPPGIDKSAMEEAVKKEPGLLSQLTGRAAKMLQGRGTPTAPNIGRQTGRVSPTDIPPLPRDKKDRVFGKEYVIADGRTVRWTRKGLELVE